MRITWENLGSLEYVPVPGIEYEIAEGCIRTLRRPVYDVMRAFMDELGKSAPESSNPIAASADEDAIRMRCLEICTEGDAIPDGWAGVDFTIASRAVSDFFTFRIPRPSRPPAS